MNKKTTTKRIAKRKYTIEHYIKSSDYHRNGVGGAPFIQVHFSYEVLDQGEKGCNMLATIGFKPNYPHVSDTLLDPETCRVTDLDDLEAQHRGEWFASFLIPDLAKFETRMGHDVEVRL
jgi:hypothetical protein